MTPKTCFSVAFTLALVLCTCIVPRLARAQAREDAFQTGITGSAPSGRLNPSTMMNESAVRGLILRLAETEVPVIEAEKELSSGTYTVEEMVEAGLARVEDGTVRLALNFVSADDQRLIASKARGYGRELADAVFARRDVIEAAVFALGDTADERRAILFFLVGCVALDWDGLGYTQETGYRAGATVEGPGFAYTPWMKENATDISRRGLYWGSHNRTVGDYTFTTFGDHEAVPRIALPDLFFSLANPFSTLDTTEGSLAARRLLGAYSNGILADVASVLLAIHGGARNAVQIESASGVAALNVGRILALLETIRFVAHEDGAYTLQVTVLEHDAKAARDRIVAVVRDAMDGWHERRYADVKSELSDLTALRRGVPFDVIYTEIWHYIFGYANLFLAESGFLPDPYADEAPFRGFFPFLWANAVDP